MRETAGLCISVFLLFVFMMFAIAIPVPVSAQTITTVSISNVEVMPDSSVTTPILINNVTNLGSGTINVAYSPSVVHVTGVASGTGNALKVQSWNINNTIGVVRILAFDANIPHSGNVTFANLTFKAVASTGSTPLNITVIELADYDTSVQILHTLTNGTFTITPSDVSMTTISLFANPETITADGFSTATITACLRTNGNPVADGTEVNFSTSLGTIQSLAYTDNKGNATTTLTASTLPGTAVVTATSGTAIATIHVVFTPIHYEPSADGGNGVSSSGESFDTPTQEASTSVSIAAITAPPDGSITVPIMVNHVTNLGSGTIDLSYNPEIVHVTDVESGTGNALVVQSQNINNTIGLVRIVAWDSNTPHSGNVLFANLVYKAADSAGSTPLNITVRDLIDYHNYTLIPHSVNNGTFTIIGVPAYGVVLTIDKEEKTTAPDVIATYYLTVSNTGNVGDTFDLSVDNLDNDAIATLNSNSVTIPAGQSTTVLLNVTSRTEGICNVCVTAISQGNTIKSDTITTRTIATSEFSVPPEPEPEKQINPALALIVGPIVVLIAVVIILIYIKTKRKT